MFKIMREDVKTVFSKDPAARGIIEVLTCYPGLHAVWMHRFAHYFWTHKFLYTGRLISHINRWLTGIEIHPGATIGRRFFIDHGMGVVIGETAEIGDDVLLYKGVLLGGTSLEKKKRHPTLKNNVVVGSDAIILGAITLEEGARVGAGSVVLKDVPEGATVVGVPARIAKINGKKTVQDLEHGKIPDPILEALTALTKRQEELEEKIKKLGGQEG